MPPKNQAAVDKAASETQDVTPKDGATSATDKPAMNGAAQDSQQSGQEGAINLPPADQVSDKQAAEGAGLPPEPTEMALRVRSRSPMGVFRRAGHVFHNEPKTLPLSHLAEGAAEKIKSEPMLIVDEVEVPAYPYRRIAT